MFKFKVKVRRVESVDAHVAVLAAARVSVGEAAGGVGRGESKGQGWEEEAEGVEHKAAPLRATHPLPSGWKATVLMGPKWPLTVPISSSNTWAGRGKRGCAGGERVAAPRVTHAARALLEAARRDAQCGKTWRRIFPAFRAWWSPPWPLVHRQAQRDPGREEKEGGAAVSQRCTRSDGAGRWVDLLPPFQCTTHPDGRDGRRVDGSLGAERLDDLKVVEVVKLEV